MKADNATDPMHSTATTGTHLHAHAVIRLSLAGTFAYAVAAKLVTGRDTASTATILSDWVAVPFFHYLLIAFEALLVLSLVAGWWSRGSAIVTILLLSGFSGLIFSELRKEHPKPCGCAGAVADVDDPAAVRRSLMFSLGRNGLMMAGAAWLFLASGPKQGKEQLPVASDQLPETDLQPIAEH